MIQNFFPDINYPLSYKLECLPIKNFLDHLNTLNLPFTCSQISDSAEKEILKLFKWGPETSFTTPFFFVTYEWA
jgi:hypothetical protein